jgi:hypothetical protein
MAGFPSLPQGLLEAKLRRGLFGGQCLQRGLFLAQASLDELAFYVRQLCTQQPAIAPISDCAAARPSPSMLPVMKTIAASRSANWSMNGAGTKWICC